MVITINYWAGSHHHISAPPHPSGTPPEHISPANVHLEFSSPFPHTAFELNSHVQVPHVNVASSFHHCACSGRVTSNLYLCGNCSGGSDPSNAGSCSSPAPFCNNRSPVCCEPVIRWAWGRPGTSRPSRCINPTAKGLMLKAQAQLSPPPPASQDDFALLPPWTLGWRGRWD